MSQSSLNMGLPGHRPNEWDFIDNILLSNTFCAIGVTRPNAISSISNQRFNSWLAQGYHANMAYMSKNIEIRSNPAHANLVPNASAVVVAAMAYGHGNESTQDGIWSDIARHARGRDYHKTLKKHLKSLAAAIKKQFPDAVCRMFVDSAPLLERSLALSAGVGSLGKNGAIIVKHVGPAVLLGEVICANVPEPDTNVIEEPFNLCGTCTKCIDACPTQAIVDTATIDANRCLSYWSIEAPPSPMPAHIGCHLNQIFGCDICTSICPLNRDVRSVLEPPTSTVPMPETLNALCEAETAVINDALQGTALYRTGATKLQANAQIVLTNRRKSR